MKCEAELTEIINFINHTIFFNAYNHNFLFSHSSFTHSETTYINNVISKRFIYLDVSVIQK